MSIGRNELGHRYYTEDDIQLFLKVKELKEKGNQLKSIREQLLPQTGTGKENLSVMQSKPDGKILEFHQILERLIAQEMKLQDQEEGRCRSLDHMIRSHQIARREAAAAAEAKKRKKK